MTKTLFDTCMIYIVNNMNLVDNLIGFPDLIGEKIFRKFISLNSTSTNTIHGTLKMFVEAYRNQILERLSLFKSLLILNEYLDSIVVISSCITELCLCSCYLGENHDIYNHIGNFQRLKKLCLRKNSMNDKSIMLLTLRSRVFKIGGKEIEYLDLADNNFTDEMLSKLYIFPKLNFLNLTGSNISKEGIKILSNKYNLEQVFENKHHQDITNEGWATVLLDKWKAEFTKRRELKLKNSLFRLRVPETLESSDDESPCIPLVFQKQIMPECLQPPTKKIKL